MISVPRRTNVLAMSNQTFDVLRFIAQIVLPAAGALYFGLAQIWNFPAAEQVVGTIALVDTFLGVLLGYQRKKYESAEPAFDGALVVTTRENPAPDLYSLELSTSLDDIPARDTLILKVETPETE